MLSSYHDETCNLVSYSYGTLIATFDSRLSDLIGWVGLRSSPLYFWFNSLLMRSILKIKWTNFFGRDNDYDK